jgi:hypothetical protein
MKPADVVDAGLRFEAGVFRLFRGMMETSRGGVEDGW